ncbi:MAG: hypothetical protein IJ451_01040 [Ruminococcus sp.]|nr:hypothetical protein [Ruminococcus sp.]
MDKNKAWEIFAATGKVQDYLNFKSLADAASPYNNDDANEEDKNRRTDNKTTEYR